MGVQTVVNQRNASPEQLANAEAYRALIARTGRFLTFAAGAATIGYRLREDPAERAALRIVKETDTGPGDQRQDRHAHQPGLRRTTSISAPTTAWTTKAIARPSSSPVNAPGVTVVCRKPAARDAQPVLRAAQHAASTSSTARCGSTTC